MLVSLNQLHDPNSAGVFLSPIYSNLIKLPKKETPRKVGDVKMPRAGTGATQKRKVGDRSWGLGVGDNCKSSDIIKFDVSKATQTSRTK
jgi:hypothetical protein